MTKLRETLPGGTREKLGQIARDYKASKPEWYKGGFMTYKHPDAFKDLEKVIKTPREGCKICPVCQGYGTWNLELNTYGEGRHFQSSCSHCNGWGEVDKKEICQEHIWIFYKNLGNCYNQYICSACGKKYNVDSSD
jgi:hypothetical protein